MNVAVLGASNKPDRYSYKAVMLLRAKGHVPFPVHPSLPAVEDIPVHASLTAIPAEVDTLSVYLSAANQRAIEGEMLSSSARRVIFNPGAENPELAQALTRAGKEVVNACTLVMLSTGQF